jgi:hypothetical protein
VEIIYVSLSSRGKENVQVDKHFGKEQTDMKPYDIVKNPTEDIRPLGPCDGYERTSWMALYNATETSIKLCVFQAKCSFADKIPEPNIADTGTFVGGVQLPAGADVTQIHVSPVESTNLSLPRGVLAALLWYIQMVLNKRSTFLTLKNPNRKGITIRQ